MATQWAGIYICGGGFDTVVVECDGEPRTFLVVDPQVFNDFAYSEDPDWDNWSGMEVDSEDSSGYAHEFGGEIIAERVGAGMPDIYDADCWQERREFWGR